MMKRLFGYGALAMIPVMLLYAFVEYLNIRPNIRDSTPITYDESVDAVGYRTVHAMSELGRIILDKPGGYISNDYLPPFVFMDDMPNFEYGVVSVLRKSLVVIRDSVTRNQTQSQDNPHAVSAFTHFNIDNYSWMFPSVEGWWFTDGEYRLGVKALQDLEKALIDPADNGTEDNFYTRATSLAELIASLNRVMGNSAQSLGNAALVKRVNIDLQGEPKAEATQAQANHLKTKTKFKDLDDNFWEANGSAWATLEILRAVRIDFVKVLEDKNALPTLDQIIEQLEASQRPLMWPWVANGTGFSGFANHSLILKSYISNASQSMSDLIRLLKNG